MKAKHNTSSNDSEYIQSLKDNFSVGPMVEVNQSFDYKIKIIGRGEQLFYQQAERALICEIQVRSDLIYQDSIRRWDDGSLVDASQRQIILDRIVNYFKVYQKVDAKVV